MNKKSGWDLLIRSIERQYPKEKRSKEKNQKPEKQVEKSCLEWAKNQNIYLHVVEAKAVFSASANLYLKGQVAPGFPDLVGNNNNGQILWIELKAKGRRSTVSVDQYEFLKNKIDQNCFAVVVDSSDLLNTYYYTWLNNKNPKGYLMSLLPYPSALKRHDESFDPELGF